MHGLANRAIESFVQDNYGADVWREIAARAGLGFTHFEAMMTYDDAVTLDVIIAASDRLSKRAPDLLEDLGTYIVSHPNMRRMRRLLRFGGADFEDFLLSLSDLPGRARLALPGERMPEISVTQTDPGIYAIRCGSWPPGFDNVVRGMVRAMADDYGALALLDVAEEEDGDGPAPIEVQLLTADFSEGRSFSLSDTAA